MNYFKFIYFLLGIGQIIGGIVSIIRGFNGSSSSPIRAIVGGLFLILFGFGFSILPYIK